MSWSSQEAAAIVGAHYKSVDAWARVGVLPNDPPVPFLVPSVSEARGKGTRRTYAYADLVALRLAVKLKAARVPLRLIRPITHHVQNMPGLRAVGSRAAHGLVVMDLSGVLLHPRSRWAPSDKTVRTCKGGELPNVLPIAITVDVNAIAAEVDAAVKTRAPSRRFKLPAKRRPRG
jgi:hypothetical protein